MKSIKLLAVAAALTCAIGTAQAQNRGPDSSSPSGAGYMAINPSVANPGDTSSRDAERVRDEAIEKERGKRGKGSVKVLRAVPAAPDDINVGAEVFDSKGVRVGAITEKTLSVAVLQADGGKVEVPLEAFGKNDKGLLIAMTKAQFDALVAEANKPAG